MGPGALGTKFHKKRVLLFFGIFVGLAHYRASKYPDKSARYFNPSSFILFIIWELCYRVVCYVTKYFMTQNFLRRTKAGAERRRRAVCPDEILNIVRHREEKKFSATQYGSPSNSAKSTLQS